MDEEVRKYLRQTSRILSCLIFDMKKYKRPLNSELYRKLLK